MTKTTFTILMSAALALAGCQGSEEESALDRAIVATTGGALGLDDAFPPDFDPCALISMAEAAEATGRAVEETDAELSAYGIARCTYEGAGLLPPVVLEVRPGEAAYETAYEVARSMTDGEDNALEVLKDVGERAFYSTVLGHNIVLVSGGRFANLIVVRNPDDDNRGGAVDLARRVAERLAQ